MGGLQRGEYQLSQRKIPGYRTLRIISFIFLFTVWLYQFSTITFIISKIDATQLSIITTRLLYNNAEAGAEMTLRSRTLARCAVRGNFHINPLLKGVRLPTWWHLKKNGLTLPLHHVLSFESTLPPFFLNRFQFIEQRVYSPSVNGSHSQVTGAQIGEIFTLTPFFKAYTRCLLDWHLKKKQLRFIKHIPFYG